MDVMVPLTLWEEDEEGVITAWLAGDGEHVKKGALLAEIMVQKVQLELISPANGKLEILQPMESVVRKGDLIAKVIDN